MTNYIDWRNPKTAAEQVAGNWQRFESFGWDGAFKLYDPDNWFIFYTSNRDSGLLDQSNEAAIDARLEPLLGDDLHSERHNHWAVGHLDGYAVRVLGDDGMPTAAFVEVCRIKAQLADYPILNEDDYSEREYNATVENIKDSAYKIDTDGLPDDWAEMVYSWLWDNDQGEIESGDDGGGYPSEDAILEALSDLGLVVA